MEKEKKKTRSRGNGEGTIFKRKIRGKEVWVSEYTLGIDDQRKKKMQNTLRKN